MTISELTNYWGLKVDNQFINLGYENGWNTKMHEIYSTLRSFMIPDSQQSENLGNCVTEYRFTVDDGTDRYIVVSKVDSSD